MSIKLSEKWIRSWLEIPDTTEAIAERLTLAGLEVESYASKAPALDQVVVARIIAVKPHPNADRLNVCQVSDGSNVELQVVCGCPSVKPGLTVALAKVSAVLPNGLTIKKSKIRGEVSEGMMCSAVELGLASESKYPL